jgi:hypothetical protein
VTLQSPTILLEATTLITDAYAGYGGAMEAYGANVPLCLDYGHNNSVVNTANIYNIQNVFGVYENETNGFDGAGFGKSIVNENGIRIDLFANAIHELVNGNPLITPALGSNIIYGADGYTGNNAYAYNFDINGFLSQIASFIPSDYRVKSQNLMDFVNEICSQINHIYYVDLLKPQGSGKPAFNSGHTTTLTPTQTHAGTVYGGQVVIITQNRNNTSSVKFPLSRGIIGGNSFLAEAGEKSDKLGGVGQVNDLPLDIGMRGSWHPDGEPLGSSPYGGDFPVEDITPDELTRYSQTNLSVRLNEGAVGARYVVGGYQSRVNYVSTYGINRNKPPELVGSTCPVTTVTDLDTSADVYQYWGDINISARLGQDVPNIPVLTHLFQYWPSVYILIDCYDIFGDITVPSVTGVGIINAITPIKRGIYFASITDIRRSLLSYESWIGAGSNSNFLALRTHFSKIFFPKARLYNPNGSLTFFGRSLFSQASSVIDKYNTSASDTEKISDINSATATFASTVLAMKSLYERISSIAEKHYGKTYAVKCPAHNVKQDSNDEAPLNQFIKSWDLADDGFLDPSNYSNYEAPSSKFTVNGRLKAHANYYSKQRSDFEIYPGNNIPCKAYVQVVPDSDAFFGEDHRLRLIEVSSPDVMPGNSPDTFYSGNISFSNYNPEDLFYTKVNNKEIITVPVEIDKSYLYIPALYFTFYEVNSVIGPLSNYGNWGSEPAMRQTKVDQIADFMVNLSIPLNGVGCIPFALVKTNGVFRTTPDTKIPYEPDTDTDTYGGMAPVEFEKQKPVLNQKDPEMPAVKTAIHPKSFCIPQQSNRYTYGPWITQINLPYGTKVEYVRDESLVPENFLLPANVSIGGVTVSSAAGYAGMNAVGQLMANTVENFDFLFTEEGSVTIPGYPKITHLGQSLIAGGPLVSDISVSITASTVSTQYSMKTFSTNFSNANKYVADKLTRLGRKNG